MGRGCFGGMRAGTYGNDFDADQLGDFEEIVVPRHAEEEGDGVANVTDDELDCQRRGIDVEVPAPPRQEAVCQAEKRYDAEDDCDNHACDLKAEPGAAGERVEGVRGTVLVVVRDDDAAGCEGFFSFRVTEFGYGEGGRDGHDAGGDESLRVHTQPDVSDKDGAGDGGEAGAHYLVEFGCREMGDEGADEHGAFALTNKGRGGCDDGFGPGDAHGPEEEDGELADEPLEKADVVQELDEGDEEDDGGDDDDEEPA